MTTVYDTGHTVGESDIGNMLVPTIESCPLFSHKFQAFSITPDLNSSLLEVAVASQ